jgi:hypothetical protein
MSDSGQSAYANGDCGKEEVVRHASVNPQARFAQRAEMYRSESFRLNASALLRVDRERFNLCLDVLLVSSAIPRSRSDSSEDAAAEDASFILAALGAGTSDAMKLLQLAKRILFMEFQCEFGEQATDDRKGKRRQPMDPYKECFGTLLAKTIREVWADEGEGVAAAAVTIGWAPGRADALGAVEFPCRETTFLYSTAYLFPDLHEGIGVFHEIKLNFAREIQVTAGALLSLGRLWRREDSSTTRVEAGTLGQAIPDSVQDAARYVISDPATNTGWTHLFERREFVRGQLSDVILELECRFVYDRTERKLLHLDVIEHGLVTPGSETDRCDLEDSLENANPYAIEDPQDAGLDVSNELPAWCESGSE